MKHNLKNFFQILTLLPSFSSSLRYQSTASKRLKSIINYKTLVSTILYFHCFLLNNSFLNTYYFKVNIVSGRWEENRSALKESENQSRDDKININRKEIVFSRREKIERKFMHFVN